MDDDLSNDLAAHRQRLGKCLLTVLSFRTGQPRSCGIIATAGREMVKALPRKGGQTRSERAQTGPCAIKVGFLDHFAYMQLLPSNFDKVVAVLLDYGISNLLGIVDDFLDNRTPRQN